MTSNDPAAALAIPDGFNEALAAWQAHCECLLNDDHRKSPYWLPITECWSERKMQHAATLANYCVDALASVAAKDAEIVELKETVFALRSLRGPDGHLLPSEVMETGLRMREPTHEEIEHLNNCASCRFRFDVYRSSVPPKDGKYPNLEAIAQGCISGAFREWPMVRPEVVGMFAELTALRARLAELEGAGNKI